MIFKCHFLLKETKFTGEREESRAATSCHARKPWEHSRASWELQWQDRLTSHRVWQGAEGPVSLIWVSPASPKAPTHPENEEASIYPAFPAQVLIQNHQVVEEMFHYTISDHDVWKGDSFATLGEIIGQWWLVGAKNHSKLYFWFRRMKLMGVIYNGGTGLLSFS